LYPRRVYYELRTGSVLILEVLQNCSKSRLMGARASDGFVLSNHAHSLPLRFFQHDLSKELLSTR
ncbi:MAG TPA: hypothetical protein VKB35_16210, partial [Ktedonobacteraceae bacterium]|nr:hypothetical protein [Ktedonobacteraceae bacterium]